MSTPVINRLSAELNQQWHAFIKQLAHLRRRLDFARDHYYLTQEAEPVLELLKPGIAWVAQGRYGPTLISRDLLIWDVDDVGGYEDADLLRRLHGSLGPIALAENRSFRIYRTRNGIRVIATQLAPYSGSLSPYEGNWFKGIGETLNADRAYMAISSRQKCSRARLAPKDLGFRFDVAHPPEGPTRACRFIGWVGAEQVHPELSEEIDLHDRRTEALDSDKELF